MKLGCRTLREARDDDDDDEDDDGGRGEVTLLLVMRMTTRATPMTFTKTYGVLPSSPQYAVGCIVCGERISFMFSPHPRDMLL